MREDRRENIIFAIVAIIVFALIVLLSIKTLQSNSHDGDYETICIRGHTYYRSNFGNKIGLAVALNNDGRPIRCEIQE